MGPEPGQFQKNGYLLEANLPLKIPKMIQTWDAIGDFIQIWESNVWCELLVDARGCGQAQHPEEVQTLGTEFTGSGAGVAWVGKAGWTLVGPKPPYELLYWLCLHMPSMEYMMNVSMSQTNSETTC